MRTAYSFGIYLVRFALYIVGLFNSKIKSGVHGRKQTFKTLEKYLKPSDKCFWFHCASLGEYEQGLPVFEELKEKYSNYKIVLSFFSPSGYDVRKNSPIADVVVYLPLDTPKNVNRFLNLVNPQLTIFVKYEFWPNYLIELKKRGLNCILISAVFRKNQSFFKWYGSLMRKALKTFNHIFTQDENSKILLSKININHVTVAGDTRFDRVSNQLLQDNTVDFIEDFVDKKQCIVFGSTWPDDDSLILEYINKASSNNQKFIIAPHKINSSYVDSIKNQLKVDCISYTDLSTSRNLKPFKVFILDTIGYLNKAYSYADIAYVGGAAGTTGLHNILEPAIFGIPILIGKNYDKFPEAKQLIALGGVHSVRTSEEFTSCIKDLVSNTENQKAQGQINRNFIERNKGAVIQILNYIRI